MPDRGAHAGGTRGTRGVLYPARLPTFVRIEPPEPVAELVRWFWIPEWDLAPGRTSRQYVIGFPASNLVVDGGAAALFGPTTRIGHRDLVGTGWAVGALLRPAAVRRFVDDPGAIRDGEQRLDAPDLVDAVTAAMHTGDHGNRHRRAVAAFGDWLTERIPTLDDDARLANAVAEMIDADPTVVRVADVAAELGLSVRTLQRLCRRFVGLTPAAMIRRRRLQDAAEAVRTEPGIDLAALAADLGYADQAHLARDFRTVLGFTASSYRNAASSRSGEGSNPAR